jgi:hypothetical protein
MDAEIRGIYERNTKEEAAKYYLFRKLELRPFIVNLFRSLNSA